MGMISSVFHLTLGNTVQKISERLYLSYKETNESPVAKFNIAADPEAAKIVLESGIPIQMLGLYATRQTLLEEADADIIREIGNLLALKSGIKIRRQNRALKTGHQNFVRKV